MKFLVVMRHGDVCGYDGLTCYGEEQTKKLAQSLYERFGACEPYILCSSTGRTRQTSKIIAKRFGVNFGIDVRLNPDSTQEVTYSTETLQRHKVVIIVSHERMQECQLDFFARKDVKKIYLCLPEKPNDFRRVIFSLAHILDIEKNEIVYNFC